MTNEELKRILSESSRVFVLTDANVAALWLLEAKHWLSCEDAVEIVVKPGEEHKTLLTAQRVWSKLLKEGADRQSILINMGGGTISDLGGFVASCYQRGIRFVNVPTTLLAMVDAAIGGKNGVDFKGFKNQIGTFAEPIETLIMPVLLSTLPERELLSGLAEMLKYGYIADSSMLKVGIDNYQQYLLHAGRIKREIVGHDFHEQGSRKVLNFGHTLGHAFESLSYTKAVPLTHGESVALGMWCALWLSVKHTGLPKRVFDAYEPKLKSLLSMAAIEFDERDVQAVLNHLAHDKKNRAGENRWVLLTEVGCPVIDCVVPELLVRQCVEECIALTPEILSR